MTSSIDVASFFDEYAAALVARDAAAVSGMYAVPGLILFPGQVLAVESEQQTEAFFAASWEQYRGIDRIERTAAVIAEAPGSVWVDVTWSYGSPDAGPAMPRERFCYQLIATAAGPRIAVLTPMELGSVTEDQDG